MPDTFHTRIRTALADKNLQAALDANAERRRSAREQSYASLPEDWHIMQRKAHDMRSRTIENLDHYLEQFISRAQSNGLKVHKAKDAAQAVQIVLDIASQKGASLIAKSKTMVSEEIGLNHALEAAGLKVVETDLGEYIIQLRGEPPAHIITPAVHLNREQVGETFHQKLGVPFTDDITTMTSVARGELRQTFLSADIGVSGVNFGVAETGTLCIVTNEGNGRMVTTVPPVHIALMGIERLVPTLEKLALVLALLPRSATGQNITVYTNLINSPRLACDPDGPDERHLILVDNGRTDLRKSPLSESLLCIRCGACLNACPVFREIGGHSYVNKHGEPSTYPGPIGSVISPGLFGQNEYGHLARASSLCGACKEACPVDIDLPKLLSRVRAGGTKLEPRRAQEKIPIFVQWGLRVFTWFATDPRRFSFAQRMGGVFSRILAPRSPWLRLPSFTGWGFSKDIPRPATRSFRNRWASRQSWSGVITKQSDGESSQLNVSNLTQTSQHQSPESLVTRFAQELSALNATFTICEPGETRDSKSAFLIERILTLLRDRDISKIQAWDGEHLPYGLLEELSESGIEIIHEADPTVRGGLTGALAAVADTGTLVLPGGSGRPHLASLLPEVHIAILRKNDIYPSLEQVLQLPEVRESAFVTLVSGPSRTADIEMTLTIGVHGPREVHVFGLEDN